MRKFLLFVSIIIVGLVFISRLFYLQVYSTHNVDLFEDNAIRKVYDYPKRGFVYDREGSLLVANQPSYDVMFVPREVKPLDTLEFCSLLKINKERFKDIFNKAYHYSPWVTLLEIKVLKLHMKISYEGKKELNLFKKTDLIEI